MKLVPSAGHAIPVLVKQMLTPGDTAHLLNVCSRERAEPISQPTERLMFPAVLNLDSLTHYGSYRSPYTGLIETTLSYRGPVLDSSMEVLL
jgi:hypothetical protein